MGCLISLLTEPRSNYLGFLKRWFGACSQVTRRAARIDRLTRAPRDSLRGAWHCGVRGPLGCSRQDPRDPVAAYAYTNPKHRGHLELKTSDLQSLILPYTFLFFFLCQFFAL